MVSNYIFDREKYFGYYINRAKLKFILNKFCELEPKNVLEVGAGFGILGLEVSDYCGKLKGIEISDRLKVAKSNLKGSGKRNVSFVYGDATKMKFDDDSFDLVYCSQVLEHIPECEVAIKEIARVSKKNIIIDVPTPLWEIYHFFRFWLWVVTHPVYVLNRGIEKIRMEKASIGSLAKKSWRDEHVNKWSGRRWREVLEANGIRVVEHGKTAFGLVYFIVGEKT